MPYQLGGLPAPERQPRPVQPGPEPAPSVPGPGRKIAWGLAALVVALGGVGLWWLNKSAAQPDTGGPAGPLATVRTVTATRGDVERTLRLTGVTAADRYVSLNAPQLSGHRHGMSVSINSAGDSTSITVSVTRSGGGGRSGGSSTSGSSAAASGGGSDSSSGSSASTATASTSSSASTSASSASNSSASSSSSALTSRFASTQSAGTASRSSAAVQTTATASEAMGFSGLGSTSTSGGLGGGGGGGGTSDWMMALQELTDSGAHVRKGDVVAAFDRQYMLTRLDDYRDTVTQAEASFRMLKANLDVTRKAYLQSVQTVKADLDKARLDLNTIPVQSAITTETLKLAEEEAGARNKEILAESRYVDEIEQAQLRTAEIELKQARKELRRVEANIDRMQVKTPLDGIAVVQPIIRGTDFTTMQAGDQIYPGQLFMKVVDTNSMIVNAFVNQADVEVLRIGARALVHFDAYPDLELPAHVYSVGALGRTGRFRANFLSEIPVTLRLDKLDPRVIPDLSVSVDVILGSESGPALAPREALYQDPGQGNPYVFVKGPSGWSKRDVSVGLMNNMVAVIRSGLRPGEVLAAERPPERIKNP